MKGPIFLVGMMGCGKSTVGRVLADRLGCAFIDLDLRIERITGMAVPVLFEAGEEAFRATEGACLRSLLAEPGFADQTSVVATGGGIVLDPENLAAMEAAGAAVYVRASEELLLSRLGPGDPNRPLLRDPATTIPRLLSDRRTRYEQAAVVVDAHGSPAEVASRIRQALSVSAVD